MIEERHGMNKQVSLSGFSESFSFLDSLILRLSLQTPGYFLKDLLKKFLVFNVIISNVIVPLLIYVIHVGHLGVTFVTGLT